MAAKRGFGRAWTVVAWAGSGLLAGSLAMAAVAAWAGWGSLWEEFRAWWLFPAAAAMVVLYRGLNRLLGPNHPGRPGHAGLPDCPGSRGAPWSRLFVLGSFVLAGLVLTWFTLPTGAAEAFTPPGGEFRPSQTAVRQWLITCGLTLGFLFLLPTRAPRARPRALSLTAAVAGALAVVLPGVLVEPLLFPKERHTVADGLGEAAAVPRTVSREGWAWEPPAGAGIREVVAGTHGPLVLLGDGVVALDGATGAELWTYRFPHPGAGPKYIGEWNNGDRVWTGEELVYVEQPDEGSQEGLRVVALDARTGALVEGDHPGSMDVRADREQRRAEAKVTWSRVVGEAPDCHQAMISLLGDLAFGQLGCAEWAGEYADYSGLAWAENGPVDFALVAVDPETERELWRREWTAEPESGAVRWFEGRTAGGEPVAVLEPGPGLAPVGLDPASGEEVLDFPEDLFPREEGRSGLSLLQADTSGLVVATEVDEGTHLQRSNPAGDTVAAVVLEGVRFEDTAPRRAVVLGEVVVLPVGGNHASGVPAEVLAVPLPSAGNDGETGQGAETSGAVSLGAYPLSDVVAVPGAAVVVTGDEYGPTGLRALLP